MKWLPVILLSFAVAACNDHGDHDHDHDDGCGCGCGEEAHGHEAMHGGTLAEFGAHEGHLEMKLDHDAGTCTVWAYDADMETLKLDAPPVLLFTTAKGPQQVTAKESNGGWVFTHEGLKGEPKNARFRLKANGKTYSPAMEHAH